MTDRRVVVEAAVLGHVRDGRPDEPVRRMSRAQHGPASKLPRTTYVSHRFAAAKKRSQFHPGLPSFSIARVLVVITGRVCERCWYPHSARAAR